MLLLCLLPCVAVCLTCGDWLQLRLFNNRNLPILPPRVTRRVDFERLINDCTRYVCLLVCVLCVCVFFLDVLVQATFGRQCSSEQRDLLRCQRSVYQVLCCSCCLRSLCAVGFSLAPSAVLILIVDVCSEVAHGKAQRQQELVLVLGSDDFGSLEMLAKQISVLGQAVLSCVNLTVGKRSCLPLLSVAVSVLVVFVLPFPVCLSSPRRVLIVFLWRCSWAGHGQQSHAAPCNSA